MAQFRADVVIEAVGRPETYRQAFYARDLAGTVVLVGVPAPAMRLELPLLEVFGRGGTEVLLVRRLPAQPRLPHADRLVPAGPAAAGKFVSEKVGLEDVEAAFDEMGTAGCCARW